MRAHRVNLGLHHPLASLLLRDYPFNNTIHIDKPYEFLDSAELLVQASQSAHHLLCLHLPHTQLRILLRLQRPRLALARPLPREHLRSECSPGGEGARGRGRGLVARVSCKAPVRRGWRHHAEQ